MFRFKLTVCVVSILLASCGGGGADAGNNSNPPEVMPLSSGTFELLDPTPTIGSQFGSEIVLLDNNNIVIGERVSVSNSVSDIAAVHLFSGTTGELIASYDDIHFLVGGSGGVYKTVGNNFMIVSPYANENGLMRNGSIFLVNGDNGELIGNKIVGDDEGDQIGGNYAQNLNTVAVLANGNVIVASPLDDVNGFLDAGSVRLIDGRTGLQLGPMLVGEYAFDQMGSQSVTPLANNNYIVLSSQTDFNGRIDAGSAHIVSGETGNVIDDFIRGSTEDFLGSAIAPLSDGKFVFSAWSYDVSFVDAGVVSLHGGGAGTLFPFFRTGNKHFDKIANWGVTVLNNDNYVIKSTIAADITLVNGQTNQLIASEIGGFDTFDLTYMRVLPLENGHFIMVLPFYDVGGGSSPAFTDEGTIRLYDGTSGAQIGPSFIGASTTSGLGHNVKLLPDGQYVFTDDDKLYFGDGSTGIFFESPLATAIDGLGSGPFHAGSRTRGVEVLENNNVVVSSPFDDPNGVQNGGTVILVDGVTGVEIGTPIIGTDVNDYIGGSNIFTLPKSRFAVVSHSDNENGISDAGSIQIFDGETKEPLIDKIVGTASLDVFDADIYGSEDGSFIVVSLFNADNNGLAQSGKILLVRP